MGVLANCFENCLRAACSAHSPTPTLLKVMTEKLSLFQRQKLAAEALQSKSAKAAAEGGLVENQEEEEDEEMWAKSRGLPAETWPLFCLLTASESERTLNSICNRAGCVPDMFHSKVKVHSNKREHP